MAGKTGAFSNDRVVYVERHSGKSRFGYCQDLKAWTFTYYQDESYHDDFDACEWQVKSDSLLESCGETSQETVSRYAFAFAWQDPNQGKGKVYEDVGIPTHPNFFIV